MAPLFGAGRGRAAQERAAQAEADRIRALAPADLVAELMGAFGDDGARAGLLGRAVTPLAVTEWMLRAQPRPGRHLRELHPAVRDGLHMLERAGLLEWHGSQTVGAKARLNATALGLVALHRGTVRDYLTEAGED
jgi:hypothetical protein